MHITLPFMVVQILNPSCDGKGPDTKYYFYQLWQRFM